MIALENLALRRGSELLFADASMQIHRGERIGIIGRNGCGKTSLLKLLQQQLDADSGSLSLPDDWQIACMAQEIDAVERSALDYVLDGHAQLRQAQQQLATAEQQHDDAGIAAAHGELDQLRAWEAEAKAAQLLAGLGFETYDGTRAVNDFSGGWRMRLNLARALMSPSDCLLLDEPTNHLDIDAVAWLERWLLRYDGTLMLISHDRDFLDAVCTRILSFEHGQLQLYSGNYSAAEQQRAQRQAQQQAQAAKVQARVDEINRFVSRFRAQANKARQAQSRLKELDRLPQIEAAQADSPYRFELPAAEKSSDPLLHLRTAELGYGDSVIISQVNLSLRPGQRVAVLGRNGAGKSTLLKSLAGEQPVLAGERTAGEHLHIGYFAQHQLDALDLDASPMLQLQRLRPAASTQSMRDFLGGFGFGADAEVAGIRHFSGGEKARLALAILAWQRPNLLILDEPTNHLDMQMRHALTVALTSFAGSVLLVSHDRHLLRSCADELWHVHGGRVQVFRGSLDDYVQQLQEPDAAQPATDASADAASKPGDDRKHRRQQAAKQRQRLAPLRKSVQQTEHRLQQVAADLQQLHSQLSDEALYENDQATRLQNLLKRQGELKKQHAELEELWLQRSEALEQAKPEANGVSRACAEN
jgi:ATP-binding cassette, subfamily F, member 3